MCVVTLYGLVLYRLAGSEMCYKCVEIFCGEKQCVFKYIKRSVWLVGWVGCVPSVFVCW